MEKSESAMENAEPNHEPVYDKEIFPLMKQVIDICKRDGIPLIASFWLRDDGPDGQFFCTSFLVPDKLPASAEQTLRDCLRVVRCGYSVVPKSFVLTVTADGRKAKEGN